MGAITDLREIVDRLNGGPGFVAMYCRNEYCIARQITVHVKPYGETIPKLPCCPFCRSENLLFTYVRHRNEMLGRMADLV